MKLIVNIPAFNEEEKIAETIERIQKSFKAEFYRSGAGRVITKKLIQLVDDGSDDKTVYFAKKAGVDLIVSYKPNRRLAYAFKQGAENALQEGVDFFVNIDADGQFDPEEIPLLLGPVINKEADMVVANRFAQYKAQGIPWIKSFLNQFAAKGISFFLGVKIDDLTCGFRAHSREALLRLNLVNLHFTYTQETIIDAIGKRLSIKWVPVNVTYFADRQGKITKSLSKFILNGFKIILKAIRDVQPLKFFGWPAAIFCLVGVGGFFLFLVQYFQEFKISPYLNLIIFSALSLFLGVQFLIFALIADMIKGSRQLTEEVLYRQKKENYKVTK
ncbi:MAG TPA: glycosyltransferase family 2 protein [Candidatus Moranbacteria bacterium]|nr:glycosyltransferase family 2 protein [Candidatus Moranbacteria bacterium]